MKNEDMVSFSLERRAKTRQVRFLILYGGNLTLVNSFDTKFYRIIVLTLLYEGASGFSVVRFRPFLDRFLNQKTSDFRFW